MAKTLADIERLQAAARQQTARAGQTSASAVSLPNILKDSLNKLFAKDNPLFQQRESAIENFFTAREQRAQELRPENLGGVILQPSERRALIAQRRAQAVAPLTTINDLINLAIGGIGDITERAGTTFQAAATREATQAELLGQRASDALQLYQQRESERQFQQELALQQADSARAASNAAAAAAEKKAATVAEKKRTKALAGASRIFNKFKKNESQLDYALNLQLKLYPQYYAELIDLADNVRDDWP
jgi:hypothetical protein